MRNTIKGVIEFLLWPSEWKLTTDVGVIDLSSHFWTFAEQHRNKLCSHELQRDFYQIKADDASKYELRYEQIGWGLGLVLADGSFGFSNVTAYLESSFHFLNGRHVIVDIEDHSFRISADPDFKVFGVKYKYGNDAFIPEGAEQSVCKVGTTETCIFLTCGPKGFECAKFNGPLARLLLARKAEGSIRATRIGDCECLGRVEE